MPTTTAYAAGRFPLRYHRSMPKFKGTDPTTSPNPQALPLAPTAGLIDEIPQRRRARAERHVDPSFGDTRTDFPPAQGSTSTYPSTETTVDPMTQK